MPTFLIPHTTCYLCSCISSSCSWISLFPCFLVFNIGSDYLLSPLLIVQSSASMILTVICSLTALVYWIWSVCIVDCLCTEPGFKKDYPLRPSTPVVTSCARRAFPWGFDPQSYWQEGFTWDQGIHKAILEVRDLSSLFLFLLYFHYLKFCN